MNYSWIYLYRTNQEPPGTPEEKVWYAKKLYESAFHPDSGELQNVIGRMSFQVPGGMILTAGMLQFYRYAKLMFGYKILRFLISVKFGWILFKCYFDVFYFCLLGPALLWYFDVLFIFLLGPALLWYFDVLFIFLLGPTLLWYFDVLFIFLLGPTVLCYFDVFIFSLGPTLLWYFDVLFIFLLGPTLLWYFNVLFIFLLELTLLWYFDVLFIFLLELTLLWYFGNGSTNLSMHLSTTRTGMQHHL